MSTWTPRTWEEVKSLSLLVGSDKFLYGQNEWNDRNTVYSKRVYPHMAGKKSFLVFSVMPEGSTRTYRVGVIDATSGDVTVLTHVWEKALRAHAAAKWYAEGGSTEEMLR